MYTLIRSASVHQLILEQGLLIAVSLVIAEIFYKFHSFTLECLAFLATWYILERTALWVRSRFVTRN